MDDEIRQAADRILLERFVPGCILVNSQLEIMQFRGPMGPFMAPVSGQASLSVLKLLEDALVPTIRQGLGATKETGQPFQKLGIAAELQGKRCALDVCILPVSGGAAIPSNFLIVLSFSRSSHSDVHGEDGAKRATTRMVAQLREELTETRKRLALSLSEQETSNASLHIALEELQTANEELQITNEELAAGKSELESTNEQLVAASDQAQMRNAELSQLLHDHLTLMDAANVAALLFGEDLRLRRISALAANLLGLSNNDIGQPLNHLRCELVGRDLELELRSVLRDMTARELEMRDHHARRYTIRLKPYVSIEGHAEGVVMTLSEVTQLRAAEEGLASALLSMAALEEQLGRPVN